MTGALVAAGIVPGARVPVAYDPGSRDAVLLGLPPSSPTGELVAPAR